MIYGGWAAQNLVFMFGSRFTPAMWLNVAGCALAAAVSVVTARALHGEIAAGGAFARLTLDSRVAGRELRRGRRR
ncbi:MAG: hypothetical protein U0326_08845 [Polyangiales bacterium]